MTPVDRGATFAPSPQAIALVRARLEQMGLPVTEATARSLLDAVLAVEGPRLHLQVRGAYENSLEIIRDTAESALGGAAEPAQGPGRRVERSDLLGGGRRPIAARPPLEDADLDDDDPRPVFKRPRR